MKINDIKRCKGFFGNSKSLHGTVQQFEQLLGYKTKRLSNGFFIGHLLQMPSLIDFELGGYSNVPGHKFTVSDGLDKNVLKTNALAEMMKIGTKNLIKIFPNTLHNNLIPDDEQYPSGLGIQQWKLTNDLPFQIYMEVPAKHQGIVWLHGKPAYIR